MEIRATINQFYQNVDLKKVKIVWHILSIYWKISHVRYVVIKLRNNYKLGNWRNIFTF